MLHKREPALKPIQRRSSSENSTHSALHGLSLCLNLLDQRRFLLHWALETAFGLVELRELGIAGVGGRVRNEVFIEADFDIGLLLSFIVRIANRVAKLYELALAHLL